MAELELVGKVRGWFGWGVLSRLPTGAPKYIASSPKIPRKPANLHVSKLAINLKPAQCLYQFFFQSR